MTLPTRLWRSGDELGRWCTKSACRGRRRAAREALPDIDLAIQVDRLNDLVDLLTTAVMADAEDNHFSHRRVCFECGLTTALPGWVHPANATFTGACFGTLDGATKNRKLSRDGIARAWPFPLEFVNEADREALRDMG